MASPRSERVLRSLVADLSRVRPQDRDAILRELSPGQRPIVEDLLQAYSGMAAPPSPDPDAIDLRGFSPALAERLRADASAPGATGRMTEGALSAFRACARQTAPPQATPPSASTPFWPARLRFRRAKAESAS